MIRWVMMIREIQNKEEWEGFLRECEEKTFLHSWNWGEFNKMIGKKIWHLGVYDNDELLAACLVVRIEARRGIYLLVEHGPIASLKIKNQISKIKNTNQKLKILTLILEKLKEIAKEEKASFVRVCPIWERTEENIKIFRDLGFRQAPMHEHPEISWVLALDKTEDELLMGMRKTTRYLIRQAQKFPEIEIVKSRDIEDINIFNEVYQKTGKRGHFVPFSLKYLRNEFQIFLEDNQILLFLGKYKNEVVAGAMLIFWQDRAFYHQGASLRKYAKIPVSYLLQWEAIKEAKSRGLKYYSFWGIADINQEDNSKFKSHPWAGLTLFKKGFGGQEERYVKTQDFVLNSR